MGMDIYAGTLTRYFSKDWKTAAQVYAEEKGLAFQTIYSQGQEESTSQQEIMEWVCRWRDSLTAALSEALDTELLAWEESGAKDILPTFWRVTEHTPPLENLIQYIIRNLWQSFVFLFCTSWQSLHMTRVFH